MYYEIILLYYNSDLKSFNLSKINVTPTFFNLIFDNLSHFPKLNQKIEFKRSENQGIIFSRNFQQLMLFGQLSLPCFAFGVKSNKYDNF